MPRAQRTQLKKTEVLETPTGAFESKPVGTVDMPFVVPQKTLGQSLAEGLGVATKGAAAILQEDIDEKSRVTAIRQKAYGMTDAKEKALAIIDRKPKDISNATELFDFYKTEWNKSVKELSEADEVHSSYLEAFNTVGLRYLADDHEKLLEVERDNKVLKSNQAAATLISESLADPSITGSALYEDIKQYYTGSLKNLKEIGEHYVSHVTAIIKQNAQDNPAFDWDTAIKEKLEITTKDGIDFAKHPVYGKSIDTLRTSLTTLNKSRVKAAEDAQKEQDTLFVNENMHLLTLGKPTAAEVATLSTALQDPNIQKRLGTERYSKLINTLDSYLDQRGFGSVSRPDVYNAFLVSAKKGELDTALLAFNKSQLTQADYLRVLGEASKYDIAFSDNKQKQNVTDTNRALRKGTSLVAQVNADGVIVNIGGDTGGPMRALELDERFTAWRANYVEENNGNWPTYDLAYAEVKKIAADILKDKPDAIPNIPNYILIKDLIEAGNTEAIKEGVGKGTFTKQNVRDVNEYLKKNK